MSEVSLRAKALQAVMGAPNGRRKDPKLLKMTQRDPEFAAQFDALVEEFITGGELAGRYKTKQKFIEFLLTQPQLQDETVASMRAYILRREQDYAIKQGFEAAEKASGKGRGGKRSA